MEFIKDRLRKLRKERALNQDDVAYAVSVARGTYASYENGITPPTGVCIKLAEFYRVSMDYILCVSNERQPAGGRLSLLFSDLAHCAGDSTVSASDISALIEATLSYYMQGAPCGDIPLLALHGFSLRCDRRYFRRLRCYARWRERGGSGRA